MVKKNRKSLMLDGDMVEAIKRVSENYGMPLASYIRNLIREALAVERRGLYAPAAIKRALAVQVLADMGFVYVPMSILKEQRDARKKGREVGRLASKLGLDFPQLLDALGYIRRLAIITGDRAVVPVNAISYPPIKEFVIGLAQGMGLRIEEEEGIIVVYLKG